MLAHTPRSTSRRRSTSGLQLGSGVSLILLAVASYVASTAFDGGFGRGFFQGAALALVVLGAFLAGSAMRSSRTGDVGPGRGGHWLPSRDGDGDDPR